MNTMKNKEINAFLGKNTGFEGLFTFQGTVRIDGHFKGKIESPGGSLIVGEQGTIHADIEISFVTVSGEIHGNILAGQRIDIQPSGKITGDIQTPVLIMREGAVFDGNCRTLQDKAGNESGPGVIDLVKPVQEPDPPLGMIHGVVMADTPRPDGPIHDVLAALPDKKKEPLKKAAIIAVCNGKGKRKTVTDASGHYEFADLEDGLWKLTVKAKGYEAIESEVEISGGGVYEKNF
ncbi:MAG: polymer-forming cytoskeletal protein [Pseudomonadota bacterium]